MTDNNSSSAPETLEDFAARMRAELDAFVVDWRKHQAEEPEDWPETYDPAGWDEQFTIWMETRP